jgi:hypothetical protein
LKNLLALDSIIPILASKVATGNRPKFVAVSAGVIIAVVFGPTFVDNNEFVKNNYDALMQWKSTLSGTPYPAEEDIDTFDQDAAQMQDETDTDVITTTRSEPSQLSGIIDDGDPDPETEFVPATVENNQPSIVAPSEFDDSNFSILLSDPKKFINYKATITGQVYDISHFDNGMNFKIFNLASSSPDNSRASVSLEMPNANIDRTTASSIQVEDCIIIQGLVRNVISEKNSLGQSIQVPLVEGSSIGKIDCIDSALPVYSTVEMSDSASQHGLSLTVQKIQFAGDHVRIKLVAENSGSASMFIRDRESLAVQDDRSYPSKTHLPIFSEYRLDSKLAPESLTEGYLFFEQIDHDDQPITFRIVVEQAGITETARSIFTFTVG